jgi:hypothetical protein
VSKGFDQHGTVVAFPLERHAALPAVAQRIFETCEFEERSKAILEQTDLVFNQAVSHGVPSAIANALATAAGSGLIDHLVDFENADQMPLARR